MYTEPSPDSPGINDAAKVEIDHGKTFTNYTWMDVPFEGEQVFLGDYTSLTATGDRVYGVWTEAAPESITASAPQGMHRPATVVRVGTADFSKLP